MLDNLLSVLLGELLIFVVTLDGLLDLWDFILRQVAATVFAVFPGVEVVVGAVRPLTDNGEGAVLHALDRKDLFNQGLSSEGRVHGRVL